MEKKLLLGDEAIALGAIHAGIRGVYAYPGTPSTEITEYIQRHPLARARGLHSTWCTNEKTAVEAALGASYAGARVIACMKHVGLNVAADAFVNAAITGVNGGMIVVVADDPSMHSSQNEQDSRFYGKFSMITTLEPSTQQEAYDMMQYGFELSEREKLPVLMRIVMRLAHSRAARLRKERQHHLYQTPDKHGQQQLAYHAAVRHEITGKRKNASAVLPIFIFHLSPIIPRLQHQNHTAPFIFGTSSNPTSLKFFSGIGKALRGRI